MKEFRVEYTMNENYCTDQWDTEIVEAESAEEAIELLKQHFIDETCDVDQYLFRCREN